MNEDGSPPLAERRCVPCEGGVQPLADEQARRLLRDVPSWSLDEGKLRRRVEREDFATVMRLVNAIAELAEAEGHHPDFCVHFSVLDLSIWTHAIGGLSENDFVLAAKIDALLRGRDSPAATSPGP